MLKHFIFVNSYSRVMRSDKMEDVYNTQQNTEVSTSSPDIQSTKRPKDFTANRLIAIIAVILILGILIVYIYKSGSSLHTNSTHAAHNNTAISSTANNTNSTAYVNSTNISTEPTNTTSPFELINYSYLDSVLGGTWSSVEYYSGSTRGLNSSAEYFQGLNYMDPITNATWENLSTNIAIIDGSSPSQFLMLVIVNYTNSTVAERAFDTEGKSFISYISRNSVGVNSTGPINFTLQNGAPGLYTVLSLENNESAAAGVIKYNNSLVQLIFALNSSLNRSIAANDIKSLTSTQLGLNNQT